MVSAVPLNGEKGETASLVVDDLHKSELFHKAHKAKAAPKAHAAPKAPKAHAPKAPKAKGIKAKGH